MSDESKLPTDNVVSESIRTLIKRHGSAFEALQKQTDAVIRMETDHLLSKFEDGEQGLRRIEAEQVLSHLDDEVRATAVAMTTVPLSSITDIIALVGYIEEFSQAQTSGYLLWPETVPADDRDVERPWAFAVLANIRLSLLTMAVTTVQACQS